jgi:hypothetical protein
MALKASNVVVGNPVTLHHLMVRRIDDVFGSRYGRKPLMSLALSISKQGSGVGHTLNASLALGWPS